MGASNSNHLRGAGLLFLRFIFRFDHLFVMLLQPGDSEVTVGVF